MLIHKYDEKFKFASMFNTNTGFYIRTGVFDDNGRDTGVDPSMTSFPELIDVGIMQTCVCANKCNVDCYQKAINRTGDNMSLENFKRIAEECDGKTFQFALGGAGDVDTHENFEEILRICHEHHIVPNFTTSGIAMTKEKAEICKKFCGAVAVSEHNAPYTKKAIRLLLDAGVKTNIHYVLGQNTIEKATAMLETNAYSKGINAVIFLLYKPIGLGRIENVLKAEDKRVQRFFNAVENYKHDFKIGFDSCTVPGILNFTHNINPDSIDTCEGARWSMYITPDMKALPCSFDNQELRWAYDISNDTIQNAWDSDAFEDFRNHFRRSCPNCKNREQCMGGCPIRNEVVLCNRLEREVIN